MSEEPSQELRIAVTMTGGVSLAIWMGGVARELNLLSMASRHSRSTDVPKSPDQHVQHLYRKLLDLTQVSVDIDVLSGTSAGGINAAVLGYAQAKDLDIEKWGAQWNSLASLEDLLRNPKDKNPPSLLLGDKYLFDKLGQAFAEFDPAARPSGPGADAKDHNKPETTVFITTTLLHGETSRFTDSYGTLIQDTDHHGLFRFDHASLADGSPDAIAALALAGRCTSSFPGAFEPSFLPFDEAVPAQRDGVPRRPPMDRYANTTRPHWVADGGLLANRPIGPLLETIFDRPADGPVRRVLLYVVPSSGPAVDPLLGTVGDDPGSPLSMTSALIKDLGAVLSQSISSDLGAIREHNDTVDALTDSRLQLAQLGAHLECRLTGIAGLLDDYRRREGRALAQPVVREVMRLTDAAGMGHASKVPAGWVETLDAGVSYGGKNTEQECLANAMAAITAGWSRQPPTADQLALFGRPAWDGAKATVLAMLRAAQKIANPADCAELHALRSQVHGAFAGIKPRPEVARIVAELLAEAGRNPVAPDLQAALASPAAFCAYAARKFATALATGVADPAHPAPSTDGLDALRSAWQQLGKALTDRQPLLRGILDSTTDSSPDTPGGQLRAYVTYLFDGGGPGVAERLFDLHAAQRALTPLTGEVEQSVELIQVSADTRTALDPKRSTADRKLTGMQLQHFGAFYKRSWRANDWMWGRVDAAGWLVHMVLQPQRLRDVTRDSPDGKADLLAKLKIVLDDEPGVAAEPSAAVLGELEFLKDRTRPLPPSLPETSMWIASALQRRIVDKELPIVAEAITVDVDRGAANWRDERQWVNAVLADAAKPVVDSAGNVSGASQTPATTAARLDRLSRSFVTNPVPAQTFASEVGQPLLARTVGKAMATGTNALTTAGAEISALKPLFASLRGVTLTTYQATKVTKATPRALLAGGLAMIVVGFVLAVGWGNVLGLGGIGLIVAGIVVLALGVWGVSWRGVLVFLGFLVVLLLVAPAFPVVRRWLFSTDPADLGALTPWLTSLPTWLGSTWWHPIAVLGGLLVVVAGISLAVGHSGELRRRDQAVKVRIHQRATAKG